MKKKNLVLMLAAMMLVGGTTTYAASSKTVQATVANFKYTVNGFNFSPSNSTKPVTINGQTYIPASVVKEALKTNVTVDAKSGKINFGEKLAETPIMNEKISYDFGVALTKDGKFLSGDGKENKEVILFNDSVNRITLYPNNKYQTVVLNIQAIEDDLEVEIEDAKNSEPMRKEFVKVADGISQVEFSVVGKQSVYVRVSPVELKSKTNVVIYPSSYYK